MSQTNLSADQGYSSQTTKDMEMSKVGMTDKLNMSTWNPADEVTKEMEQWAKDQSRGVK